VARSCQVCGKGFSVGNQVTIRGKAKYLGGVGTKVTGITKRKFKPNLQRLRVTV
jgi:large subunit ribosomal protein L28